ncbi:MAG: nuclear transport factor 2 family protein [Clostridiales bacterium]|nr:nuclear transport factor 2 family protein [Clostridiales bacterium]
MSYKTILKQYATAVYNKDAEGLLSLYDSNVCVYDTWNEWRYDIGGFRNMVTGWFDSLGGEKVRVEFTQGYTFESQDQTVWVGELKFYGLSEEDEVLRSISNRWTWVIKNSNGMFKIVHEHSSLPINIENFSGIMKKD